MQGDHDDQNRVYVEGVIGGIDIARVAVQRAAFSDDGDEHLAERVFADLDSADDLIRPAAMREPDYLDAPPPLQPRLTGHTSGTSTSRLRRRGAALVGVAAFAVISTALAVGTALYVSNDDPQPIAIDQPIAMTVQSSDSVVCTEMPVTPLHPESTTICLTKGESRRAEQWAKNRQRAS